MSKTILIDGNNAMIRSLHSDGTLIWDKEKKNVIEYDWQYFEFKIFQVIYYAISDVNASELVFAIDGDKNSIWRKLYWPRYKESRKKDNKIDWCLVFSHYKSFMGELKENFPFKILRHKNAEGDDIIGIIVQNTPQKHHIISVDKDFMQLYEKNRVSIYSPLKQAELKHPSPEHFIIEQCLLGQSKDDIFNIKTALDHPQGKRKPGFGPKALEKVITYGWKKWLKENKLEDRFEFNRNLMDFKRIPKSLQDNIMKMYKVKNFPHPDKMYKYIEKKNWNYFLDNWTNVEQKLLNLY
jgi:hypothetical protein